MSRSERRTRDTAAAVVRDCRERTAGALTRLLADTYVTRNTTQLLQWNVPALRDSELGKLLRRQRCELGNALDDVARTIREQGSPVLATLEMISALSTVRPPTASKAGRRLFRRLGEQHRTIARRLRRATAHLDLRHDPRSADLLRRRLEWHEHAARALRKAACPLWGAL